MIRLLELKGYKSLRAMNAFHSLMLGLKMLPDYQSKSYEEFFQAIEAMPEVDQKKLIKEAALFVELQKEEIEALISFTADPNGVPYGPENIKSLGPAELIDIIVAVCGEIAKIKVDFVSDSEKKN